ncbi:MAG TPA: hypothetical protein DHV62_02385 [Elusimicrobia bacterium]|nr:hypothetical protein [Elusimicrobiota bacterium]
MKGKIINLLYKLLWKWFVGRKEKRKLSVLNWLRKEQQKVPGTRVFSREEIAQAFSDIPTDELDYILYQLEKEKLVRYEHHLSTYELYSPELHTGQEERYS